jgi:Bacterial fructose-1,6-bisphosphatase, glpX-encoded
MSRPGCEGTRRPSSRRRPARALLRTVAMTGTVVIGEGEKDQAPMLVG